MGCNWQKIFVTYYTSSCISFKLLVAVSKANCKDMLNKVDGWYKIMLTTFNMKGILTKTIFFLYKNFFHRYLLENARRNFGIKGWAI